MNSRMPDLVHAESEEDVGSSKKQKRPTSKVTPTKKTTATRAKGVSATPPKTAPKKEVKSLADFFGKAPVKRTPRSTRSSGNGDQKTSLGKRKGDIPEVKTVPESPTEAAIMEFSDEAVALALQEDIAEMNKEKVKQYTEFMTPLPPPTHTHTS